MIGIYKITSPSGRVYIGQSINIVNRWRSYRSLSCSEQSAIYNSLRKYGVDNHKFEVLIECNIDELNDLERYYQDLYNVLKTGLNCRLTGAEDRAGKLSEEHKRKIGLAHKGRSPSPQCFIALKNKIKGVPLTQEVKDKISFALKGEKSVHYGKKKNPESVAKGVAKRKGLYCGVNSWRYGKKLSEESRRLISINNIGKKAGVLNAMYGKTHTPEARQKISLSQKGRLSGGKNYKAKKVIDTVTNEVFECIKDAAEKYNLNADTLRERLRGFRKNNTNLIYYK